MKYTLPYFGELDLTDLEDRYDVSLEFKGEEIDADLNFDEAKIEQKHLDIVKNFLDKLTEFDAKNHQHILNDFRSEKGDTVKEYLSFHLEQIPKDELVGLVDFNDTAVSPEEQLFKAIKLVRVGFYPHDEEQIVVFDYSIGRNLTDHIIVVDVDKKGNLNYITMES